MGQPLLVYRSGWMSDGTGQRTSALLRRRVCQSLVSNESIALVVLAGGQSARFGVTKGLYDFEGEPLVMRVINALGSMADRIIIGVAPRERSEFKKVVCGSSEIVVDRESYMGPLLGLRDALEGVSEELVMLAPCDMPFISSRLYQLLFDRLRDHDAALPVLNGYPEPMTAIYRLRKLSEALSKEVSRGGKKLSGILGHLDYVAIPEDDWQGAGVDIKCLLNLNSPP